ncbi:hypothetical protein A3F00_02340 [Candidatus Daviesbacteria bacterium RIFCSPHIGHO2_12_FULL_37_11]|uniref:Polysaccharide biosynthesis protein C-terminal domain-containing protein n=1 Tax=Candidatus Daviesbacteria bacterium RIFCSPHIGHO2_12_FULL_37_11 TaxID=1797777 RepID=A0A1F5K9B2_9BACT|nr:MAG: hypothetical protein A2769_00185 [Candidatus Daviesbacteria bacterium RIFCSPHIGHO2_01_FULL_37_27]OGE37221.1 MAG: hypothetical protein A3F00_02340 [Candidatus Daviesbacteria bacterium RIFCSPHIGHO2_12_FULL_37_11]OGE46094.1 MAG: hypothetical protein A3B39_00795 [Candidatus Daviesbacteria bacterium RIFCSPLOWO2_01_FULL_37_10]
MTNYKLVITKILKHPLFTGSAIMVIGHNIFNIGQFFYYFLTIRLLNTTEYGDLAAIISILGIIGIIQLAFGLTIVKFVASQKTEAAVSNLIKWFNYWGFLAGGIAAVLLLLLSPIASIFLNLTQPKLFYLISPMFFLLVIVYVYRSVLQGLLLFKTYIASLLVDVVIRISFTALLILLGTALFGAIIGMFIGIISGFIITRSALNPYFSGKRGLKPKIMPLLKYSFPVLIQGLAFTSFYSTDILLVKHFFSPHDAGTYAYLSVLGRIAMFCTSPITSTMFPIIAKRFASNLPYLKIFYICFLLVTGISLFVVLIFKLVPDIPISLLNKNEGQDILWWFGLFMAFLGIALLFEQFYLSIGKTKPVWFFVAAAALQAVFIWFIHPSLFSVVQISVLSTALLNIALFVYFPYYRRHG